MNGAEHVQAMLRNRHPALEEVISGRRTAVLYPAARMARTAAARLISQGVHVIGFGDGNPALWGTEIDGLPVWSPSVVVQGRDDSAVLIASSIHDTEIHESLVEQGCSHVIPMPVLNYLLPDCFPCREYSGALEAVTSPENIAKINQVAQMLADETSRRVFDEKIRYLQTLEKQHLDGIRSSQSIYFDQEVVSLSPSEVVVDGGAYDGDTFGQFLIESGGHFKTYYAFEPDPGNFAKLQQRIGVDNDQVVVIPAGLADHTGHLAFECGASFDSHLASSSNASSTTMTVQVHSLDDFFANLALPSFIKLDVEGAEALALSGAKKIIETLSPTLALSVYHKPSDLWELPLFIHSLNPRYRLYLRHYTREIDDTVCYAVSPDRQIS